jgi:NADP-dependent 3-hydroxy acid dehydrogenase YdfG
VSRIFITGSTDGLGRAAASVLMGEARDLAFQDQLTERLAALTGVALF